MEKEVFWVSGVVEEGHHVASGPSQVYPYGTLRKQAPFFKERGLDLDQYFLGTINISITPLRFEMVRPAYTFRQIAWTNLHPPEDFSFSPCRILFQAEVFDGFVYYPHPETKIRHFQDPSVIEVITKWIPAIVNGSLLEMVLEAEAFRIWKE
jgi:hypothetical protein